ncbi:unnamed protein product [Durusdinium trenchii]|uniref:Uncharacterized protein n=1 Tax=Durusdinium trenchii TaxID=1381693 RepID=A0ABP0MJ99_9DINO
MKRWGALQRSGMQAMTLIFRDAKIPRSQWLAGVAVEHDAYVHEESTRTSTRLIIGVHTASSAEVHAGEVTHVSGVPKFNIGSNLNGCGMLWLRLCEKQSRGV